MIKKISCYLGGIFFLIILLILILPTPVFAAEGECHLKHCLVPAPTILQPENGATVTTTRPAIRALTWKTTVVKVFLDGIELKNIKQRKHEDYYGSVFVVPDFDLTPGTHYIYTIAYSEKPGWYDQSKESLYVDFSVSKIKVVPVKTTPKAVSLPQLPPTSGEITTSSAETGLPGLPLADEKLTDTASSVMAITQPPAVNAQEQMAVSNEQATGTVEIQEGRIEEGVSLDKEENAGENLQGAAGLSDLGEILKDEFADQEQQQRERNNRLAGLVMLGMIIMITIIWLVVGRQRTKREMQDDNDEGELPPPPTPPVGRVTSNQEVLSTKDEKITTEPISKEDLKVFKPPEPENKYWASPPPSPYSPYPSAAQKTEGESKEKQEDLGI